MGTSFTFDNVASFKAEFKELNNICDGGSVTTDVSLGLKNATVGDTIKVKAVDSNGVPTEWETADFPNEYTLPPMTGTALGGAMADPAQESDTQPVRIGADNKLYTAPGGGASGAVSSVNGKTGAVQLFASDVGAISSPSSADVGQTVVVESVNESGIPTTWKTADLPGAPVFYVNLTMGENGTITADKTFAEIEEAYINGKVVEVHSSGLNYPLLGIANGKAIFSLISPLDYVMASIICNSSAGVDTWEFIPDNIVSASQTINGKELSSDITLTASDVGAIPSPATATVGQTIAVKAVDVNGVPTEWESADLPTGGGGIYGLLEQYNMFELAYGVLDSANLPARVVITEDSGGNAFDVDGIIVWTDIKSTVSYTGIAFNNRATVANPTSHPYHYGLSHGNRSAFNLYLCGANNTFLQLLADGTLKLYKKQKKDVDGINFAPSVTIQDVPSSITAICLSSQHPISSGTFYKVWGLKKKNV